MRYQVGPEFSGYVHSVWGPVELGDRWHIYPQRRPLATCTVTENTSNDK